MTADRDQSSRQSRREPEYEITFTLAAGYDEQDAQWLYESIEGHPAVAGAALAAVGLHPSPGLIDHNLPPDDEPRGTCVIHGDYWTDDCTRCGHAV